ncbi:hypothetical protein [Actinomadura rudentiformis]|uniref:Uncharacterized protein n=1 Tax=Actinomadura rudentiformis TaxID=359158 RepID=A0A6H9YYJ7_9ACTN|nr:hypothetical protein [Actinomadura rudentiformis]KAB2351603.1 hypothetical protein F8566_05100 [Actinomadura rudentiformis]
MTSIGIFQFNETDDRDRASDGVSRYGAYLRQRPELFADWDDDSAVTTDPADFVRSAWQVATPPVLTGYTEWTAERVQNITCTNSEHDGSLIVRVQIAVPRPRALDNLPGWADWDRHNFGDPGFYTPYDDDLARRPAMLTSILLLVNIPNHQLYTPQAAPGQLLVDDAKAAIHRLAALLDAHLAPVLDALAWGERR